MARYFFHLRGGDAYVPDFTGADLEQSGECARHLMRMLKRIGTGNYQGWSFEITDESGEYVDSIKVEDLLGAVH